MENSLRLNPYGLCCALHLPAMVRNHGLTAENGEMTIRSIEVVDPPLTCDYCEDEAPAEFCVDFFVTLEKTSEEEIDKAKVLHGSIHDLVEGNPLLDEEAEG